ncbi:type VI secretion system protein TssA [Enterobacter mori]|uniref:type VI secretion system protein TssA n=1 Tax=Enterobacter mori TaxID=539813 RepID=UPI003B83DB3A
MHSDIENLLAPVSPDNPAGDNLEYEPLFDDIRSARESDPDYLPEGEWVVSTPRKADWRLVRTLSERALIQQSKDLQLACWYVESLSHLEGLGGLAKGIDFLSEFITRFWFQCWPSLNEEGEAVRRSRFVRLDRDLSLQLSGLSLLKNEMTSLSRWRQILAFEHKIGASPESREELIDQDGDLSMESFDKLAAHFSSIEISQQADRVERLRAAFGQLEVRYLSMSQDREGALFTQTCQTLADIADYLQRLTQRAIPLADASFILHPVPVDAEVCSENTVAYASEQTMNRELAVRQMLDIAHYFRQTEPSSPVPFLMERAARWANMTLIEWLEEMLADGSSMRDINNVLTGQSQP